MPRRFAEAWSRVQRAEMHLRELRDAVEQYRRVDPYSTTVTFDSRSNEYVVRGLLSERPMPIVALVAGDAVHSLRASLDYAMWEILWPQSGLDPEEIYFPVTKKLNPRTRVLLAAIEKVSPRLAAHVAALQIYAPVPVAESTDLQLLHQLDIQDKHRALNIMAGGIFTPASNLSYRAGAQIVITSSIFDDASVFVYPFMDGVDILRFRVEGGEVPKMKAFLTPEVAFGSGTAAEGQPVRACLDRLLASTRAILRDVESSLS